MDLQRLFLFLIFSFSLVMVWDGWQRYQHPEKLVQEVSQASASGVPTISNQDQSQGNKRPPISQESVPTLEGKIVTVKTDLFSAQINTLGGVIQQLSLLKNPSTQDELVPVSLFEKGPNTHDYLAESGLLGQDLPNHNSLFTADKENYELSGDNDKLEVKLNWTNNSGLTVTKVITFKKGSYLIGIGYEISNNTNKPIDTSAYFQLIRDDKAPAGSIRFVPTYTGAAVYTDQHKFQKVTFESISKGKIEYPKEANNGWIGILQHYFVAVWIPNENTNREFFTHKLDNGLYAVGTVVPVPVVAPNSKGDVSVSLYAGPARSSLDEIVPGLGLTVDYGWLTVIAKPMFWTMTLLHSWVHNWGVAIILLTVLIKLIFFPLSAASYRSMAKMRMVAPKLEKIKKQYADDREQLNKAMMELYKTEKINPLGGCLPVVIQIPVFISLYWSILQSVDMRYAPFVGWIHNLSVADPYYILPVVMGISMLVQTKLNPAPQDPMQAKLMKVMPLMFSFVFFFFPAGLVLYSVVNNMLSITQQWFITHKLEAHRLDSKK